ncbi:MAG: hydrogenase maturation protease [Acidobacteriaceae bacterium]
MNDGILIACIGNIFLGDDGFGFEVAQALAGCALPAGVEVRDYGIRGLDLAYALLCPWKAAVLVDAVSRGGTVGTLYLLQPEEAEPGGELGDVDPHGMDPVRVLAMARSLGKIRAPVYLVGCELGDFGKELEGRMGLSPEVAAAVPEAVKMIGQLANRLMAGAALEGAATGGTP